MKNEKDTTCVSPGCRRRKISPRPSKARCISLGDGGTSENPWIWETSFWIFNSYLWSIDKNCIKTISQTKLLFIFFRELNCNLAETEFRACRPRASLAPTSSWWGAPAGWSKPPAFGRWKWRCHGHVANLGRCHWPRELKKTQQWFKYF